MDELLDAVEVAAGSEFGDAEPADVVAAVDRTAGTLAEHYPGVTVETDLPEGALPARCEGVGLASRRLRRTSSGTTTASSRPWSCRSRRGLTPRV